MAFPYVPNYGGNWQNYPNVTTPITEATLDNLETQFQSVLDLLTLRGDLPYRGAATWERLAKGGLGDFLRQGANDPYWDTVLTIVRKTADQTVNNSVALVNDTHLLFPVLANEVWWFILFLRLTSATANPDIDIAFTVPAGASILLNYNWQNIASQEVDGTNEHRINLAGAINEYIIYHFLYAGAAAAGNVQLQWAQGAAVAEDTKVLENSFIIATKLG